MEKALDRKSKNIETEKIEQKKIAGLKKIYSDLIFNHNFQNYNPIVNVSSLVFLILFSIHIVKYGIGKGVIGAIIIIVLYISQRIILANKIRGNRSSSLREQDISSEQFNVFRQYILNGVKIIQFRYWVIALFIAIPGSLFLNSMVDLLIRSQYHLDFVVSVLICIGIAAVYLWKPLKELGALKLSIHRSFET